MTQLAANLRIGLCVNEIRDLPPGRLVIRRVQAGASGRDPALWAYAGHLDEDKPGTPLGARALVDQVPVGRTTVHGRVLRHR